MKTLSEHITEKLIINKDYINPTNNTIFFETFKKNFRDMVIANMFKNNTIDNVTKKISAQTALKIKNGFKDENNVLVCPINYFSGKSKTTYFEMFKFLEHNEHTMEFSFYHLIDSNGYNNKYGIFVFDVKPDTNDIIYLPMKSSTITFCIYGWKYIDKNPFYGYIICDM